MVNRATLGVLIMLLLFGLFGFNWPAAKAQVATPAQATITVSGVPTGTKGLAVEVTVDTAVVTLDSSASSSVSGALVVTGSMSEGVGVISTSSDLPASFTITAPFKGVTAGTSMVSVGKVLDMIGGTAIAGASAMVDVSSVSVASSSTSTSSSSSSSTSGGAGKLSTDTITVTINGAPVDATNALNVTLAFSDAGVVSLDTGVTFMGTGATQLLTDVDTTKNVLTAVWNNNTTDGKAVLTAMLKAGSMAGTTMISVSKVEAAGGTDITSNVVATVDPSSVTNSAGTSLVGTFGLVAPDSVTGPGKVAVAFTADGTPSSFSATLNGSKVEFFDMSSVGVAIVNIPSSGDLTLMLAVTASGMTTSVDLGTISVDQGSGKKPSVNSASASNKSSGTNLIVTGKKLKDATIEIVPTDRTATSTTAKGANIKATYDSSECIPSGSFVNVSTAGGTAAKKIKAHGSCSNKLVE
ncbi:MAG: hypothetical protein HY094_08000 [Candidatus Melainabacteria bacterium]|nr:hypothetical protein [Candidatus Melainabacteria bacterium]